MYILDTTTRKIILTPISTISLPIFCIVSYSEMSNNSFTQHSLVVKIDSEDLYVILSPPVLLQYIKQLKGCSIYNTSQDNEVVFLITYYDENVGDSYTIQHVHLDPNETSFYSDGVGWYKNASNNISSLLNHNALLNIQGGTTLLHYHIQNSTYNFIKDQDQELLTSSIVTHSNLALTSTDLAPFSISSMALNENLNADLLDGAHLNDISGSFLQLSSGGTIQGPLTLNDGLLVLGKPLLVRTQITSSGFYFSSSGVGELSRSFTASAFKGDGALITNVNADLLDGYHATQFYFTNSTVTNSMTSSTLQGTNSAGFALSSHYHYGYSYQYSLFTSSNIQDCTISSTMITSSLNLASGTNIIFPLNVNIYEINGLYQIPKTSYKIFTNSGTFTTFNRLLYSYSAVPGTASIALSFTTSNS